MQENWRLEDEERYGRVSFWRMNGCAKGIGVLVI